MAHLEHAILIAVGIVDPVFLSGMATAYTGYAADSHPPVSAMRRYAAEVIPQ